jgi:RNA recognition motif-containing protein
MSNPPVFSAHQVCSRGLSPGQQNPGNNLHVSGLSHRVESRDLENHFAAIGRVRESFYVYRRFTTNTTNRFKKLKSCVTPIVMSPADSVS